MNKLLFLLFVLSFVSLTFQLGLTNNFRKGKNRWVSTPSSSAGFIPLTEADNSPWYSDFSENHACDGNIQSISYMEQDSLNKTLIDAFMKGSVNTALCINVTFPGSTSFLMVLKISSISNLYDFDFLEHCGSLTKIIPWLNDPNKPKITNGISCHCPGSSYNHQFTPCPYQVRDTNSYSYYRGMPTGYESNNLTMCHNLDARGTSSGCFYGNKITDYNLKFETNWNMTPVFSMKKREVQELVLTANFYSNTGSLIQSSNFSLSELDPFKIDTPFGFLDVTLVNFETGTSNINDFVIYTSSTNFTDITSIYALHKKYFNDFSSFDVNKLCPVKREMGSQTEIRKWMIDDALVNTFLPQHCGPQNGTIQNPIPNLYSFMTSDNLLVQRFIPDTLDLMPGETSLLKEKTEGSISLSLIADRDFIPSAKIDICGVTKFSFTCDESINQDGFPCTISLEATGNGQAYILSRDAQTIITNFDIIGGTTHRRLMINPIYTSDAQLTLCAGCTWDGSQVCKTSKISYKIDPILEDPDVIDPSVDNGTNEGGSPYFNIDGSMKVWLIVVIVIAALIVTGILLMVLMPCYTRIGKWAVIKARKTKEYMKSLGKSIDDEHKGSNLKQVDEYDFESILNRDIN